MTENINQWLDEEAKELIQPKTYEELPSLHLTPNIVTEITVDFSKPFEKWTGEQGNKTVTKKIIPITVAGTRMNWWLNVKNPTYRDIVTLGQQGQNVFKILQTGTKGETKYVIVK